jgi:hypothetical protein
MNIIKEMSVDRKAVNELENLKQKRNIIQQKI